MYFYFLDEIRVKLFRKKYYFFYPIFSFFCMHFYKRNGIIGKTDLWKCCKCGKNYYEDLKYGSPPINMIYKLNN